MFRRSLSLAYLLLAACTSHAQTMPVGDTGKNTPPATDARASWEVDTIPVRNTQNGEQVTLGMAMLLPQSPAPLRHIVLAPSPYAIPILKTASGNTAFNIYIPWIRTAAKLNAQGIGVAFTDVPSDTANRQPGRRAQDMVGDLKQSLAYLAKKYPGVPVSVGIYSSNAIALLQALDKNSDVKKAIVASGDFSDARTSDWRNLKTAVVLVHAPSAQCDISPFYEAEYVAKANNFILVKAGYQQQEKRMSCNTGAQSLLSGLDDEFVRLVATWLDNQPPPAAIGYPTPQTAWREQLLHYNADGKLLEMTLLLPDGPGPFPVMIFNHGDIEMGSPYINYKRRFRDMIVAREFLRYGVAVAIPARPGVGMSEGVYLIPGGSGDADASYKGRLHAKSVMPAIDLLKTMPELDTTRIIISGQSAGGYSTMYIASQNPPGVIGAVNFSGGRTDLSSGMRGYLNRTMVNGFEEAGKTAHMPVLMIFAENDSRYSPNTIRSAYQAFVDAGGKATLSLSPPINVDGHFVFHQPAYWSDALRTYLAQIGIVASREETVAVKNTGGE